MYVSWRWIGEMVDLRGTPAEDPRAFVDRFVLAVAEIDGVHVRGAGLEGVRLGRVVTLRPHPNADKLRIVGVDLGGAEPVEVVCGAANVEVGAGVAFVPPGVALPNGLTVRDGEVRGVASPGMLASERELGLSDDHEGLLRLDDCDAAPGTPLLQAAPIADVLYEIDNKSVTHRPDLWGHIGFAREVAALLDRPLRLPDDTVQPTATPPLAHGVVVTSRACHRYLAARVAGVTVAPSPLAARLRLRSLGVRPINNVVDATNLVMLETGNPLHAFDAAVLRGERVVVRPATTGEALTTLDGQVRRLQPSDVVIADGEGPIALAGVMGGADSEIRPQTQQVLLEAASFDGATIRKTSARLGLRSESSARFEKGLAPEMAAYAARRFIRTLGALCPTAHLASAIADEGAAAGMVPSPPQIATSYGALRQRLGLDAIALPDGRIAAIFQALGCAVAADSRAGAATAAISVGVPWWRAGRDLTQAEDLVEEIGRQYGYDRIPSQPVAILAAPTPLPAMRGLERQLRAVLSLARGLSEVHQYSFDHEPTRARLQLQSRDGTGAELPRLRLRNTLSSENVALRRDLASGLLAALERNLSHGLVGQAAQRGLRVGLFELGRAYLPEQPARLIDDDTSVDFGLPPALTGAKVASARDSYLDLLAGGVGGDILQHDAVTAAAGRSPLPREPRRLAIALGERLGGDEADAPPVAVRERLFREAVGAVAAICAALGLPAPVVRASWRQGADAGTTGHSADDGLDAAPGWLHPARHGWLFVDDGDGAPRCIGVASSLHPQARLALEVPADVALVELDLDTLLALHLRQPARRGGVPPRFPGSVFDLTVPVRAELAADTLRRALLDGLQRHDGEAVEAVEVVAVFHAGGDFPRRVTLQVRLRRSGRSLKDSEINAARAAALLALAPLEAAGAMDLQALRGAQGAAGGGEGA